MIDNEQINISSKLKEYFEQIRLSQTDIANRLGVSQPAVSALLNGKPFGKNLAKKWGEEFGLKPNWLLTGEGEMLKGNVDKVTQSASLSTQREKGMIRYWVDIEATGSGVMVFGDSNTGRFIDLRIPEFGDCTDAVNLYGDSMFPRYKSGQIIILKKWNESYIDFGNVYMTVTKGGHRMIKVLKNVPNDNDKVLCVSYNAEYPPFPILKEDIIELYLVKGAIEKTTL